jgi:hypothetical protein
LARACGTQGHFSAENSRVRRHVRPDISARTTRVSSAGKAALTQPAGSAASRHRA